MHELLDVYPVRKEYEIQLAKLIKKSRASAVQASDLIRESMMRKWGLVCFFYRYLWQENGRIKRCIRANRFAQLTYS